MEGGAPRGCENFSLSKPWRALGWRSIREGMGPGGTRALLFSQGDFRKPQPSCAGRVWTLLCLLPGHPNPRHPLVNAALPRGSSRPPYPAPPAGLSPCPQLRGGPLLQASARTAGVHAESEGSLPIGQEGPQRRALQLLPFLTPLLVTPLTPYRSLQSASSVPPPPCPTVAYLWSPETSPSDSDPSSRPGSWLPFSLRFSVLSLLSQASLGEEKVG